MRVHRRLPGEAKVACGLELGAWLRTVIRWRGVTCRNCLMRKLDRKGNPMPTAEKSLTTAERCEVILRRMLDLANSDPKEMAVGIGADFGDFTATVSAHGRHTHVGVPVPDGSWELFVNNLYKALGHGPGLSWAEGN